MRRVVLSLLICLFGLPTWAADVRIALVIGNSNYVEFGSLSNPKNDAQGIDRALREMGYRTKLVLDADEATMRREVKKFASSSQGVDVALVYYAGHGAQVNGENYLLPTDLEVPKVETDIQLSSIKVDDIVNSVRSKIKIILLDACRDNPALAKNMVKGRGSFRGGLAPVNAALDANTNEGVFIAYATDAGNIASDGTLEKNSPFTTALLKNINTPVSIDDMFSMVTKEVRTITGNKQRPYKYASLDGVFCIPMSCGLQQPNKIYGSVEIAREKSIENNFKFIAEDRWTYFAEDDQSIFLMDFKSIEEKGNKKKIKTLGYRYASQGDAQSAFTLDSYSKAEVVIDCESNKYIITQTDIYDNKYKLIDSAFFGNWMLLPVSLDIAPGTVLVFLKSIVCKPIVISTLNDKSVMEKFWSSSFNANVDGISTKIISNSSYDKNSITRTGNKATVSIQVSHSIPFPLIESSNLKYREMTQISNLYKVTRMERLLTFNCKEDLVEGSEGYQYSELLNSPIQVVIYNTEKLLPLGSFDVVKKIACKEIS